MKYTYILVSIFIVVLITRILTNSERATLESKVLALETENRKLTVACVGYVGKIDILLEVLQSEEAYFSEIESETEAVEIEKFIGVLFWMKSNGAFANAPEVLEGSEIQILEHGMPQLFLVPEGATAYLLRGRFF
jgi:hypothetical protein